MSRLVAVGRRVAAPVQVLRRPLGRIAAFGILPAVSLLSNLVVLPILSARFGEAGWSSVLLGQSIGAAVSVVCALAWPIEGPHLASVATPVQRFAMYRTSLRQRGLAVALATPVMVAVCLLADPPMPLVCSLSAVAIALNALSPSWYFVGASQPSRSLVAEGGPRLAVNLLAIGLVALFPLWTYPAVLIAGMAATLVIAAVSVRRDLRSSGVHHGTGEAPPRPMGGRAQVFAIVARGADAGYSYLTGPLVVFVAPAAYPLYAAVDRLAQSLVNVMSTVAQGLTAWIGEGRGDRRRRVLGAVALAVVIAVTALGVLFLAAPLLLRYLFAGTVTSGPLVAFLAAAITTGAFLTRSLSLILLVPQGMAPVAYRIMLAAACVGLPLVGVGATVWGSLGALVVVATLPWATVAVQLVVGLRCGSSGTTASAD
ncbi:hypothetical protein [Geodermatophilus normandii]|uniref:O-antigen/teichoic acid export membrane protein n=1 Tax=Geodermatophilus normandii TaxID=1137989 RepID=A0A6P0GFB1_9ACTN|nr:hypothetical protein [Geodermatophilus normandii]NEM05936.1 hypothetical protein [Geodermatophilus normandii]